jgi:hypothetical protein
MDHLSDTQDLPPHIQDHLAEVREWLDKNVIVFESASTLEMKNFTFEIDKYSGTFDAVINGTGFPFSFTGDNANGRIRLSGPIAHSPLGAPCSYSLLEMPKRVYLEIQEKLEEYILPLLPLGLDKKTGKTITMLNPLLDRIENKKMVLKSIEILQGDGFKIQIR